MVVKHCQSLAVYLESISWNQPWWFIFGDLDFDWFIGPICHSLTDCYKNSHIWVPSAQFRVSIKHEKKNHLKHLACAAWYFLIKAGEKSGKKHLPLDSSCDEVPFSMEQWNGWSSRYFWMQRQLVTPADWDTHIAQVRVKKSQASFQMFIFSVAFVTFVCFRHRFFWSCNVKLGLLEETCFLQGSIGSPTFFQLA